MILIGDLNTSDLSEAYRILTNPVADLFRDTRSIAATLSGPSATYHGFRGVGINRIDYILVRGAVTVKEYTVNTFNEDGRYPSDHFPVWVRLELAEQGQEQQDTEVRSKRRKRLRPSRFAVSAAKCCAASERSPGWSQSKAFCSNPGLYGRRGLTSTNRPLFLAPL